MTEFPYRENARPPSVSEKVKEHVEKLRRLGALYGAHTIHMNDFAGTVAVLFEMIVAQQDEINELVSKVSALETQVTALRSGR